MRSYYNSSSRFKCRRTKISHIILSCPKLKQNLILGLDFSQRYKMSIDWDINRKIFLRCKGKKIATSLKSSDTGQWTIALLKISTNWQTEIELKKTCLITTTVTIFPHHISIVPLKAINQAINTKFTLETLLQIGRNPFLTHRKTWTSLSACLTKTRFTSPQSLTWQCYGLPEVKI